MRARAGELPRTMAQKILAGRSADPTLSGDFVEVKVDQIVLARAPTLAFGEALALGLKKTGVETAVAYDGACVTGPAVHATEPSPATVLADVVSHGILLARAAAGFPLAVHLERFASPARF